jgi:hypothetical protein
MDIIVYPKKNNKLEKLQVARYNNSFEGPNDPMKTFHMGPQKGGRFFELPGTNYTNSYRGTPFKATPPFINGLNLNKFHKYGGKVYMRNFFRVQPRYEGKNVPMPDWREVSPKDIKRHIKNFDFNKGSTAVRGEKMPEFYLLPTNTRTHTLINRAVPNHKTDDLPTRIMKFVKIKSNKPRLPYNQGPMVQMMKKEVPYEGKYKPEFDLRTEVSNILAPHQISRQHLRSEVNPHKAPPMGFGQKTEDKEHIVPYRVPYNKTNVFKYRGRLYDADKMTEEEWNKLLDLIEQKMLNKSKKK